MNNTKINPKTDTKKFPDRVAVIRGGNSAEREISLKSGKAVLEALEDFPCETLDFDTSPELGEQLLKNDVDVAFLALHGPRGEDGVIQGLLEWIGIPYTGPGVEPSALCMNKKRSRQVFDSLNIPSPDWFVVRAEESIPDNLDFTRAVVKPLTEGSSLGMSIVDRENLASAIHEALEFDDRAIVEEYVPGYEVTVGVFRSETTRILPPVGIRPSHEYFDFETKYTKGLTEYDVPAELNDDQQVRIKEMTRKVVEETSTESLCRVDYIVDDDGEPRILEINTIPGLTETSLLPKAAKEAGYSFDQLIEELVLEAQRSKQWQPE